MNARAAVRVLHEDLGRGRVGLAQFEQEPSTPSRPRVDCSDRARGSAGSSVRGGPIFGRTGMGRSLLPLWCGALGVGARLLRGRDQARRVGLEAVDALPGRLQLLAEPLVSNLWFQTLGRSALECRGWHRDRRADLRRLTSFS